MHIKHDTIRRVMDTRFWTTVSLWTTRFWTKNLWKQVPCPTAPLFSRFWVRFNYILAAWPSGHPGYCTLQVSSTRLKEEGWAGWPCLGTHHLTGPHVSSDSSHLLRKLPRYYLISELSNFFTHRQENFWPVGNSEIRVHSKIPLTIFKM